MYRRHAKVAKALRNAWEGETPTGGHVSDECWCKEASVLARQASTVPSMTYNSGPATAHRHLVLASSAPWPDSPATVLPVHANSTVNRGGRAAQALATHGSARMKSNSKAHVHTASS